MKIVIFLAILFSAVAASYGQQKAAPLGWDLTYKSVLERNNVGKDELIWSWLERYKSPVEKWISEWKGSPVTSSILIEYPAFHAAEHTTMWLVRTNDGAYYWDSVEGHEKDQSEETISLYAYDTIYKQVASWQQLTPKPVKALVKDEWPGYFGFISYYGPAGSKQFLLTIEDFTICLDRSCLPGKLKPGRLMAALIPILIPESERTYKHKSEAAIARMTPEQRINEQMAEWENHRSVTLEDKQSDVIQKYRTRDGLKGTSYLVELIESYNPKRPRDRRAHSAVMMASYIDDRIVRLRASEEGRRVIQAIERLSATMSALGEKYVYELDLPKLKGVTFADLSIRDTLWVKYRITISDDELLAFSNFLVQLDPTYPSWSKSDYIKDYSRINEWGSPAQVYVMRMPKRYRDAYLKFKAQSKGN